MHRCREDDCGMRGVTRESAMKHPAGSTFMSTAVLLNRYRRFRNEVIQYGEGWYVD
jgi:hypothetical protein